MRPLRKLDTGLRAARWNIALTAALAGLHERGKIEDTLRFHRYPRSVLLGCHQDSERDIDLYYCQAHGIEITRRVTGGGAVYMSPGVLAWDLVLPAREFGHELGRCVACILDGLALGLRGLGIAASFRPPGDLTVEGKKLCGTAGRFEGRTLVLQGTLLIEFDPHEMAAALRRPGQPVAAPAIVSLECLMGFAPRLSEVQAALERGFETGLGRPLASGSLSSKEFAFAEAWLDDREIAADGFEPPLVLADPP